jgi:hypothetical protein
VATTSTAQASSRIETDLYGPGITALRGAFSREWVGRVREDLDAAFADAIQRPGGAVARGPNRYYVEIHPQALRGYVELTTHPWVVEVCERILVDQLEPIVQKHQIEGLLMGTG